MVTLRQAAVVAAIAAAVYVVLRVAESVLSQSSESAAPEREPPKRSSRVDAPD